ncbi:NRPS-like enzyme [Hymenopellis radicata]|nr:NRPS-like enzyme [Hymenopellis radicata]
MAVAPEFDFKDLSPSPLDGTLALHALPEFHAKNSPDHPVFRYEDPSDGGIKSLRWTQVFLAIQVARQILQGSFGVPLSGTHPVVAILVNADTMSFFAVFQGLMQAGFVPFPISVRNSVAAVLHVLKETKCTHMIVSLDQHLQTIAEMVCHEYNSGTLELGPMRRIQMPSFESLYHIGNDGQSLYESTPDFEWTDTAVIFHSSGTTRFPSPVYLNHRLILQYSRLPYYGELDMCERIFASQGLPMYHLMGFLSTCLLMLSGTVLAVFPPSEHLVVPTSDRCLSSATMLGCSVMLTVPSFFEEWSRNPASIEALKTFISVRYGGGPLSQEAGDILRSHGVPLSAAYGLTETGIVTVRHKVPPSEGWEWMRVASHIDAAFVPVEENIFRLYIKESPNLTPAVLNAEVDGVRAIDTKDLVIRHPANPAYWKIYGRADDQIMHSTGEKVTNPVPIENVLQGDKHVANAIMFGRAKFQPGVLILPRPEYVFDPTDSVKLAEFRNKIWDTVTMANEQAPQHSRIYKEMILVASPSKPFEYTSKGSLRRIEGIYNAVDDVSRTQGAPPDSWDLKNITIFVRSIVHDVLSPSITGDMNIFDIGGDSLTATSIRNSLLRAMHQSKAVPLSAIRLLPQNFVFEFPTIVSLSAFIRGFVIGSFRVPSAQELEEEKDGYYPADPPLPMSGQTVVKLLEGKGEPPLIMIHGAGGLFFEYAAYAEKFRTAVWTLQVTPDTPLTTLDEMAAFYFAKIKEQQPTGPYRLAAYSSTSILGFALAKLFEDNGDDVLQLAMLDYFPLLFVYAANQRGNADPRNPHNREKVATWGTDTMSGLMRRDTNWPIMEKQFRAFLNASKGLPAPALMKTAATTARKYLALVADYVYDLTTDATGASSVELMAKWMASVKAPVCVYVAKTGALGGVDDVDKEEWADLGAKYLPGTRVVVLEGGHYEFLMDEKVIRDLQEGF